MPLTEQEVDELKRLTDVTISDKKPSIALKRSEVRLRARRRGAVSHILDGAAANLARLKESGKGGAERWFEILKLSREKDKDPIEVVRPSMAKNAFS